MPVHVVTDPGTQVPSHLQRIPIPQLNRTSPTTNKCVKGKVVQKYPLVSLEDDDYILKTVVQEHDHQQSLPSGPTSINAILFGALAKDFSQSVSQGDVLVMAGFTVGGSPTAQKDGLHPCNLQLSGNEACVYVCRPPAPGPSASATPTWTTAASVEAHKTKYTYAALKDLKPGMVVNVYGIVTFFKQPFRTKGTDYCSTLKITDQSDVKLGCTIFSDKLEDHPQIYKIGDIVRLHRVKTQLFNGTVNVMTSLGYSALTFDGAVGSPVVPRTSSKSFHFSEEDRRTVEGLRAWAASQAVVPPASCVRLSSVQPKVYFDLTCQLLAKAVMDSNCTLLKVWDGTRCAHPLLNLVVDSVTLEGNTTVVRGRENLVASVLVYDNHVEVAEGLKPGMYLRIYNLHAVPQSGAAPHEAEAGHLAFHLHGGTAYGRGIRVLPEDSPDLQELRRTLDSLSAALENDPEDSSLEEVWSTPRESLDANPQENITARTCDHRLKHVTLARVTAATPPQVFHVRAQLRSFQPERLHQALKLHCPKCRALRDVPDEETVASLFQEALSGTEHCSEAWALTGFLDSSVPGRKIALHLPSGMERAGNELVFVEGATLEEMWRMSGGCRNMVPVRSSEGRMALLDLSAPFFFQGTKQHYGCKQCSQAGCLEPDTEDVREWDERKVAEVLGVQLMQYVFLMKLELEDETDSVEALLWEHAESFFRVSASDAATSQDAQDWIQETMNKLRPPGGSLAERPWLDLCLRSYAVEEGGRRVVCHQIFNTVARGAEL
ncbi:protection of telomeres protein 1 [Megalops cyprinoides]|uniref:protection of telomeres protein 1 n=1 Tax=Megalops cyprinoides TaxID=118141 RepID=UPI001864D3BA|nr:protection of telomeres protein 1 [Megalops cyprinoides]